MVGQAATLRIHFFVVLRALRGNDSYFVVSISYVVIYFIILRVLGALCGYFLTG